MRKIVILLIASISGSICAQTSLQDFLTSVETNNKELVAGKKKLEAEILLHKTGLTPEDPFLEYGYFPGNTDEIGVKKVFALTQSFDFPLVYFAGKSISNLMVVQAGLDYKMLEQEVFYNAKTKYCELVAQYKAQKELETRAMHAERIQQSFAAKLENGNGTIMDANKAKIQYVLLKNDLDMLNLEIEGLKNELQLLNGGMALNLSEPGYFDENLPPKDSLIEQMLEIHPKLKQLDLETQVAQMYVNLNKYSRLPSFEAGYESETILGEKYGGIKAGVSIPLWQDKNKVKTAKAEESFAYSNFESEKNKLEMEYARNYQEALVLQETLAGLKETMPQTSNTQYLDKALDLGEITIIEYFNELGFYYGIMDQYLEIEKEYYLALAGLFRFRL